MKFALLGHQIAYSLSPVIHEMISPIELKYEIIDISPDELHKKTPDSFLDYSGLNITIPHKQSIIPYCHTLDPVAKKIGAVNTVEIREGIWKGYNTDYLGFIRTVKDNISNFLSYHPVIVGYGGVAKAVAFGLGKLGFTAITVHGGKLKEERDEFIDILRTSLNVNVFDLIPEIPRLWINCTPVGGVKIPGIPKDFISFDEGDYLYDMNYSPFPTFLEKKAKQLNIPTMNGIKMLICQAIETQKIWMKNEVHLDVDVNSIINSIAHLITVS
ncbi:MAG: shikimate dehydrogenase [Candidatus Marinimicrobia bacterium]|nr:shikimate dehydrogenase [Candidatus Neomarinimicrobiota bacterium]